MMEPTDLLFNNVYERAALKAELRISEIYGFLADVQSEHVRVTDEIDNLPSPPSFADRLAGVLPNGLESLKRGATYCRLTRRQAYLETLYFERVQEATELETKLPVLRVMTERGEVISEN